MTVRAERHDRRTASDFPLVSGLCQTEIILSLSRWSGHDTGTTYRRLMDDTEVRRDQGGRAMEPRADATRPARTVLEQRIRELRQTQEEFAEYATTFAREHNEPGTLSARHVQRLVAGRKLDGTPVGPPRPSTARLLERIFGLSIGELLAAPAEQIQEVSAYPFQVAIAIVQRGQNVLMVSPRVENCRSLTWQFPAGIIKPGASLATVAVRETLAETGVRCTVERNLGSRIHPATNVLCAYVLCDYIAGDAANVDTAENADVSWIGKTDLTRLVPAERIYPPILQVLNTSAR